MYINLKNIEIPWEGCICLNSIPSEKLSKEDCSPKNIIVKRTIVVYDVNEAPTKFTPADNSRCFKQQSEETVKKLVQSWSQLGSNIISSIVCQAKVVGRGLQYSLVYRETCYGNAEPLPASVETLPCESRPLKKSEVEVTDVTKLTERISYIMAKPAYMYCSSLPTSDWAVVEIEKKPIEKKACRTAANAAGYPFSGVSRSGCVGLKVMTQYDDDFEGCTVENLLLKKKFVVYDHRKEISPVKVNTMYRCLGDQEKLLAEVQEKFVPIKKVTSALECNLLVIEKEYAYTMIYNDMCYGRKETPAVERTYFRKFFSKLCTEGNLKLTDVTLLPLRMVTSVAKLVTKANATKPAYPDVSCIKMTPAVMNRVRSISKFTNTRLACKSTCNTTEVALSAYGCLCGPGGSLSTLEKVPLDQCTPTTLLPMTLAVGYDYNKDPRLLAGHPKPVCIRLQSPADVQQLLQPTTLTSAKQNCLVLCSANSSALGIFIRPNKCGCVDSLEKIQNEIQADKACTGAIKPDEACVISLREPQILTEIVHDKSPKKCYKTDVYIKLGLSLKDFIVTSSKRECLRRCLKSNTIVFFSPHGCACVNKAQVDALQTDEIVCTSINIFRYSITYEVPSSERYTVFIGQNRFRCYTAPSTLPAPLSGEGAETAGACQKACVLQGAKYLVIKSTKCYCFSTLPADVTRLDDQECAVRMAKQSAVGVITLQWYANFYAFLQTTGKRFMAAACVKPTETKLKELTGKVFLDVNTLAGCRARCTAYPGAALFRYGCGCLTIQQQQDLAKNKVAEGCSISNLLSGRYLLSLVVSDMYEALLGYENWHCRLLEDAVGIDWKPVAAKSCYQMCEGQSGVTTAILSRTGQCACVRNPRSLLGEVAANTVCSAGSRGYVAVISFVLEAMWTAFDTRQHQWCLSEPAGSGTYRLPRESAECGSKCASIFQYAAVSKPGCQCRNTLDKVEACPSGGAVKTVSDNWTLLLRFTWKQWVEALGGGEGYQYYAVSGGGGGSATDLISLASHTKVWAYKSPLTLATCQLNCAEAQSTMGVVQEMKCYCLLAGADGSASLRQLGYSKVESATGLAALYGQFRVIAVSFMQWSVWPANPPGSKLQLQDFKCYAMPENTSSWAKLPGVYVIEKCVNTCALKRLPIVAMTAGGCACLKTTQGLVKQPAGCKNTDVGAGKFFVVSTSSIWVSIFTDGQSHQCYTGLGSEFVFQPTAMDCKQVCLDKSMPLATISGLGCGCAADSKNAKSKTCDYEDLQMGREVYLVDADHSDKLSFTTVVDSSQTKSLSFEGVTTDMFDTGDLF